VVRTGDGALLLDRSETCRREKSRPVRTVAGSVPVVRHRCRGDRCQREGGRGWEGARVPAAVAAAVGSMTAVVAAVGPFKHHLTPLCPFHALTGLWCPFCGGTRALWAVTQGDWRLMLHANALLPVIVAVAVWSWLASTGRATGWWELPVPRGRVLGVAAAVVLVCFTVLRNLPGFGALAPPAVA
jgi:hypothetical protein